MKHFHCTTCKEKGIRFLQGKAEIGVPKDRSKREHRKHQLHRLLNQESLLNM